MLLRLLGARARDPARTTAVAAARAAALAAQRQHASASAAAGAPGGPGLFGIPRLQRPDDFVAWSREAVERCAGGVGRGRRRAAQARPLQRQPPPDCQARQPRKRPCRARPRATRAGATSWWHAWWRRPTTRASSS